MRYLIKNGKRYSLDKLTFSGYLQITERNASKDSASDYEKITGRKSGYKAPRKKKSE